MQTYQIVYAVRSSEFSVRDDFYVQQESGAFIFLSESKIFNEEKYAEIKFVARVCWKGCVFKILICSNWREKNDIFAHIGHMNM